jgi:cyclase
MLRPRIIPCLLLQEGGLVKTQVFKDPKYIGDPINAVRIFNEKEADELMVLDIDATIKKVPPDFGLIAKLAAECRMPLCYGGGVSTVEQAAKLVGMGVEKIAVSTAAVINPGILAEIARAVGQQSVVAVIDIRNRIGLFAKGYEVCVYNGTIVYKQDPVALAKQLQEAGAGEIVVNFIDRDGLMQGYDLEIAMQFKQALKVPVTFLGGAGSLDHIIELISALGVVGAAAGSLFVFKGKYRAVLINYPTPEKKISLCQEAIKY